MSTSHAYVKMLQSAYTHETQAQAYNGNLVLVNYTDKILVLNFFTW